MSALENAKEAIYTALHNDNEDLDLHIETLKTTLKETGEKDVVFVADRLSQNNRQGRKTMQAYFKKRGVKISFE